MLALACKRGFDLAVGGVEIAVVDAEAKTRVEDADRRRSQT